LHRLLRSERGLTYGAAAELDAMQQAGDYMAETSTRTATTGEALRLMVDEFARLPRQRVYESELAAAQAYLAGSFPLTIETPNQIATQVLNTVFYGLPIDDLATFRERVLAMTPDDVQRVAKAYVHPDRLAVVLVGNARAFAPQLQSVGISGYEVIPAAQLDLMSPTLRRPSPQAARITGPAVQRVVYRPAQSRAAEDPAITAVRRAIDAKGGMSALRGMKTLVADATTVLQTRPPLTATTRSYVVYPDRFRIDAPLPGGITVVQVYDRGKAWMSDPNGVTDAPPAMRDDFAAGVRRDIVSLLLGAIDGDVRVRALPTDGDSRVLEFSGRDLGPVRLYFDRDWLVTRETYTVTIEGTPVAAEEVFSDYRTVSGVKVPFQAEVRRAGSPVVSRTLTNVSINAPVDPALFDKPQR
jgi:zinc protease